MATNRIRKDGDRLSIVCTHPTTPTTGLPVRYGKLTGVALTDESEGGNASGYTSVDFGPSVWDVVVDDNEGTGIAVGDAIFYHDTGTGTPTTSLNNSSGSADAFFGFALETVGANATTLINVRHVDLGLITSIIGTIDTSNISANAVTAAKLTATMRTGFVPLPLTSFRLIASNDIPNSGAADGGVISQDTAPKLERINDATDKQLRIAWAATGVVGITTQFAYPADLDDGQAVEVHLLYYKDANMDASMVAAVNYFEGIGDTNAGANTAALTGTTATEVAVTIAAGDIGAAPKVATIEIVPGTHANDALYLLGAWIEYTRV